MDATGFFRGHRYTVATAFGKAVARVYLDLVFLLNLLVDLCLLLGANALAGYPLLVKRCVGAAVLGGVYGAACLLSPFRFLCGTVWRVVFLGLMSVIAYGLDRSALRRGILFALLSMALGGIALGLGSGGLPALIASAAALALLCAVGFHGKAGARRYVSVELQYRDRIRRITALVDTGNTLRDPVTGRPVLVVGPETAWELAGLTAQQLVDPLDTMTRVPGLRLIPYRAVGQPSGMLLGMRMDSVKLDGKPQELIVAFAPELARRDGFEALAGGIG